MNINWTEIANSNLANVGKVKNGNNTHYEGVSFSDFVIDGTVTQHFTSFHLQQGANKCFPNRNNGSIDFDDETYDGVGSAASDLRLFVGEGRTRGVYMSSMAPSVQDATGVIFELVYGTGENDWHYYGMTEWDGSEPFSQSQTTGGNVCTQNYVFVTPDTNTFSYVPAGTNNDYYVIPESKFTEKLAECHLPIYNDWNKLLEDMANNSFENAVNYGTAPVIDGIRVDLWRNFSKRKNSTKRPTNGEPIGVILKEDCDITESPSFIIDRTSLQYPNNIEDYNYLKFNNRYYSIEKKISIANNIFEFVCREDYGASWKDSIKAGNAFVLRAAFSTDILQRDELNPPSNDLVYEFTDILDLKHTATGGIFYDGDEVENPYYIVNILGDDGFKPMGFTRGQFDDFIKHVYDNNIWSALSNAMYDWRDCVSSAMMVPFVPQGYSKTSFKVGNQTFNTTMPGETCVLINDQTNIWTKDSGIVSIDFPSDSWATDVNFTDKGPYTNAIIFLPYVGVVPLDTDLIADTKKIAVRATLDQRTGNITYELYFIDDSNNRHKFSTYAGKCGADVPITSRTSDASGLIPSMALGATNPIAGALGVMNALKINTQINGAFSSYVASNMGNKVWIGVITNKPKNTDLTGNSALKGLPYNAVHSLNVSGYVQTSDAQIDMPGTQNEKDAVNSLLNSGVFIE